MPNKKNTPAKKPEPSLRSPKNCTNYTKDAMEEALAKCKRGMPVKKAAKVYKVPKSTLHDKLKGKFPLSYL